MSIRNKKNINIYTYHSDWQLICGTELITNVDIYLQQPNLNRKLKQQRPSHHMSFGSWHRSHVFRHLTSLSTHARYWFSTFFLTICIVESCWNADTVTWPLAMRQYSDFFFIDIHSFTVEKKPNENIFRVRIVCVWF